TRTVPPGTRFTFGVEMLIVLLLCRAARDLMPRRLRSAGFSPATGLLQTGCGGVECWRYNHNAEAARTLHEIVVTDEIVVTGAYATEAPTSHVVTPSPPRSSRASSAR
ncbi:MAG: hypothetical protein ACRD1H_18205, partial [Vicinamibacterales bacterium]